MYVSISVQIKFTCRCMYKVQRKPICFVVLVYSVKYRSGTERYTWYEE